MDWQAKLPRNLWTWNHNYTPRRSNFEHIYHTKYNYLSLLLKYQRNIVTFFSNSLKKLTEPVGHVLEIATDLTIAARATFANKI